MYYKGKYYRSMTENIERNIRGREIEKEFKEFYEKYGIEIKPRKVREKELLEAKINVKREKIERLEKLIEFHKKGINCDIEVIRAHSVTEIARIEKELEPLRFQLEDLLRKKRGVQIYG